MIRTWGIGAAVSTLESYVAMILAAAFPIDVHAHEPDTIYVVPITSDGEHFPRAMTQRSLPDALEARYPVLRGTIRGHAGGPRRAFIRFFACELDPSHDPPDAPLPEAAAAGTQPCLIVGAMSGG